MFKRDFTYYRSLLKARPGPGKEITKYVFLSSLPLPHGFPVNSGVIWIM